SLTLATRLCSAPTYCAGEAEVTLWMNSSKGTNRSPTFCARAGPPAIATRDASATASDRNFVCDIDCPPVADSMNHAISRTIADRRIAEYGDCFQWIAAGRRVPAGAIRAAK